MVKKIVNEFKIGDWVRVTKLGINGSYQVESIEDKVYTVVQKAGTYEHRLELPVRSLVKL